MARRVKFSLTIKGYGEVRTLEELKNNFDLESILNYFLDGRLSDWLEQRNYQEQLIKVNELMKLEKCSDIPARLCQIFEFYHDWEVFIEENEEKYTRIRIKLDETEEKLIGISSDRIIKCMLINDWIYYTNSKILKRIRVDGSRDMNLIDDGTVLKFGESLYIHYINSCIFFRGKHGSIYRINLDGSNLQKLSDWCRDYFVVTPNWIIYCENNKLMKIKHDGSKKVILSDNVNDFKVNGNDIFFSEGSDRDGSALVKVSYDGSERNKWTSENFCIHELQLTDDWIIYLGASVDNDYWGLGKVHLDGSKSSQIIEIEKKPERFYVEGDWLFIHFRETTCKVKLDGSEKQEDISISNTKTESLYKLPQCWSGQCAEGGGAYGAQQVND